MTTREPIHQPRVGMVATVRKTKPVNVDLVEIFNGLLGLKVNHIDRISGFQVVEGVNPEGEMVLVIGRKEQDLSEKDPKNIEKQREKTKENMEAIFRKHQYNALDSKFDVVYVTGDNNLMNVPLYPKKKGVQPRYEGRLLFDMKDV